MEVKILIYQHKLRYKRGWTEQMIYFDIRATIYQKLSNKAFLGTLNENRDKKGTKF